jgi:hypothetical protein
MRGDHVVISLKVFKARKGYVNPALILALILTEHIEHLAKG